MISIDAFNWCNPMTEVKLKSLSSVTILNNKNSLLSPMKAQSFEVIGNQVNFDKNCFYSSKELQSLKIEGDELNVGDSCFSDCTNLTSVSFDRLTKIKFGLCAFYNCSKIDKFISTLYRKNKIEKL